MDPRKIVLQISIYFKHVIELNNNHNIISMTLLAIQETNIYVHTNAMY